MHVAFLILSYVYFIHFNPLGSFIIPCVTSTEVLSPSNNGAVSETKLFSSADGQASHGIIV